MYDDAMTSTAFVDTRLVSLPKGGTLEIQMTQDLVDRIRYHFGLTPETAVNDDHVRMFVWGAVKCAVDKAEEEMHNG